MHAAFLHKESFDLKDWKKSDSYTQKIFYWLPDLFSGKKVYCLFYLFWPNDDLILTTPTEYETYVIHTGTEYLDWQWLSRFCEFHKSSQVVLLSPFDQPLYHCDNLQLLEYHLWPQILEFYVQETNPRRVSLDDRQYKLSSLSNRINEARSYICAYLLQNFNREEFVISWRGVLGKKEDLYFLEPCGIERIDKLKNYIATELITRRIELDLDFPNNPLSNLSSDWLPYNNCVINCSNESVSVSHFHENDQDHIMPGPYLTEKTWKPLMSGTALLPIGQYQTYKHLEKFGFKFNYPWNKEFDNRPEDFVRFDLVLDCLDFISATHCKDLDMSTKESRNYNQNHIFDGGFSKIGKSINESHIESFRL